MLVGTINGDPARQHFLARFLEESGFVNTAYGFQMRRISPVAMPGKESPAAEPEDDPDADESESEVIETA